jgi:hypothetical protein
MVAPEFWYATGAQGGFSSLQLPAPGVCDALNGLVIYSNGGNSPLIANGEGLTAVLMNTSVDGNYLWGSEGAGLFSMPTGGPFNEPYFDTAAGGFDVFGDLLAFGTGDYTVECWYRCASRDDFGDASDLPRVNLWGNDRSDSTTYFVNYVNPYRTAGYSIAPPMISCGESTASSAWEDLGATSLDTWRHLAVCRSGGVTGKWNHGALVSTDRGIGFGGRPTANYGSGSNAFYSIGGRMHIGQTRITPGVARYSGSSIEVPTAPFYTPA